MTNIEDYDKLGGIRDRVEMVALTHEALSIPLQRNDQDRVNLLKRVEAALEVREDLERYAKNTRNNNPIEGIGTEFYIQNEARATAYELAAARLYHGLYYSLEDKKEENA